MADLPYSIPYAQMNGADYASAQQAGYPVYMQHATGMGMHPGNPNASGGAPTMVPFPYQLPPYAPMGYQYPMMQFPMVPFAAVTPSDTAMAANPPRTLFIGNLAQTVTSEMLNEVFSKYGTITRIKYDSLLSVLTQRLLPQKNCAFVTFSERNEAVVAKTSTHGQLLENRPMRIGWGREDGTPQQKNPFAQPLMQQIQTHSSLPGDAQTRDDTQGNSQVPQLPQAPQFQPQTQYQQFYPPMTSQPVGHDTSASSTLFIGNLAATVNQDLLESVFSPYGTITKVKMNYDKHFGFVTYTTRDEAVAAMNAMNEFQLAGRPIRIGWGRGP